METVAIIRPARLAVEEPQPVGQRYRHGGSRPRGPCPEIERRIEIYRDRAARGMDLFESETKAEEQAA
jgi:hypothetical protein